MRIAKPEVAEPKDEYIQHYNTPRTTPEPSPVKKKIKETPSKEGENLLNNEVKKSIKEDEPNKPVDGDGQKEESSPKNDDVASEVVVLVDNLENELEGKNKRIKFLESENRLLETKVKTLKSEVKASKEATNKVEREKELLHVEYTKCCKANQEAAKETDKVNSEYSECSQQLNFTQRRLEEVAETLRVTEAILQAQEEEDDDDTDNTEAGIGEDDDDFLEDEDHPGQLWEVVQQEFNCKKCDEKIQGNKNLREHMQRHIQDQKEILPCYYCQFKTSSENEFLNHISSVHGAGHTCLTCNNTFRTQEEMIKHVIKIIPRLNHRLVKNV